MRTPLNNSWFRTGLACLAFIVSAAVGYGQAPYVFTFNSTADTTLWSTWVQTATVTSSFIAGDAPAGQNLSTGALGFNGTYGPGLSADYGGLQDVLATGINVLQYSDFSFWVKQEGTPDQYNQIQGIQLILANYGTGLYAGTTQESYQGPVAGGWEQYIIPVSSIPQQSLLNNVNRIIIGVNDQDYTAATEMNIAFDNIEFYNPTTVPEPSSSLLCGAGAGLLWLISIIRRKRS
jgi:hypothetical protein